MNRLYRSHFRIRTQASIRQVVLIFGVCFLAGCAAVDNSIRMTPTTSISASKISPEGKPNDLPLGMVVYSVEEDGTLKRVPDINCFSAELYVTVDVSGVAKAAVNGPIDEPTRNRIIGFLIYLSDRNADVWMSRTYALNKWRKGAIGTTRDLATTGAGVSALIIPPVAAGLSAFNLLAGAASDQIDSTLYSSETIETLFKAITASRRTERAKIRGHFTDDYAHYDMFYALDQVRYYDSLVSFRKGLAYLATMADQQTETADNKEASLSTNGKVVPQGKPLPPKKPAPLAKPAPVAGQASTNQPPISPPPAGN